MPQKRKGSTASLWASGLNYFAGAVFLINALAFLTGWDNFANQPRSYGYFDVAASIVFFSVGTVFLTTRHRSAK